jgi:tetratricopeptide (TPR) repeat protein
MDTYEHRSEIIAFGRKYYLQTNLVPAQKSVVTSLFHEGQLLSKQVEEYDASMSPERIRSFVVACHEERKSRINSLLGIKDKLKRTDDGNSHLKLGEALYHQNLYQESMAEVVRAVKLGVQQSRAFSILGNCLLGLGDYEKAIKSFKRGIEISPQYPDLYNDLGCTYMKTKKCKQAVLAFEKALELNKYYQEAFLNLAIALCLNVVEKEDFELSRNLKMKLRKILDMVIQLNPSLDKPEFQEALQLVAKERYDLVYDILSKMKEEGSKVTTNNLSLDLYLILKFNSDSVTEEEIDRYIEKTRRALEANPGYADRQNDLGILYTAKCKLFIDKANESFQKALSINKSFKKAEKNLKLAVNDKQGIHFLLKALLD